MPEATQTMFERPTMAQIQFSDVFSEQIPLDQEVWWPHYDQDAALSSAIKNGIMPESAQFPIGRFPNMLGRAGVKLADDLVAAYTYATEKTYNRQKNSKDGYIHPDLLRRYENLGKAVVVLANHAPRGDKQVANGANGTDFYIGITETGTEITVTPLSLLSHMRDRIIKLYRHPTDGSPLFAGKNDQYRSSTILLAREWPEHLQKVFDYNSRVDLQQALIQGTYPESIPIDPRSGVFESVDKFGNIRLGLKNAQVLREVRTNKQVTISITTEEGKTALFLATVTEGLHKAPLGEFAIYRNPADVNDQDGVPGDFSPVELVIRVDDDPTESKQTAAYAIQKMFQSKSDTQSFDFETAEVAITK